jgi:hypothetical protein
MCQNRKTHALYLSKLLNENVNNALQIQVNTHMRFKKIQIVIHAGVA